MSLLRGQATSCDSGEDSCAFETNQVAVPMLFGTMQGKVAVETYCLECQSRTFLQSSLLQPTRQLLLSRTAGHAGCNACRTVQRSRKHGIVSACPSELGRIRIGALHKAQHSMARCVARRRAIRMSVRIMMRFLETLQRHNALPDGLMLKAG